jgi:hypothetical protein
MGEQVGHPKFGPPTPDVMSIEPAPELTKQSYFNQRKRCKQHASLAKTASESGVSRP